MATKSGRRRVKRQGKTYANDPLVPIDKRRLVAAIKWQRLPVATLAARAGMNQQTLDSVVNGGVKRSRRTRRAALARVLHVTAEWLGGEAELSDVPGYEVRRMPKAMKQDDGRWADVYYYKVEGESLPRWTAGGTSRPLTEPPILPALVQLVARDAIQVLRFLFDPDGPLPDNWDRRNLLAISADYRSVEALALRDVDAIPRAVIALLSLERWRELLFGSQSRWHPTADESDRFAEAMGTALDLVLGPAIKGRCYFDLPARRTALEAQRWLGRTGGSYPVR